MENQHKLNKLPFSFLTSDVLRRSYTVEAEETQLFNGEGKGFAELFKEAYGDKLEDQDPIDVELSGDEGDWMVRGKAKYAKSTFIDTTPKAPKVQRPNYNGVKFFKKKKAPAKGLGKENRCKSSIQYQKETTD